MAGPASGRTRSCCRHPQYLVTDLPDAGYTAPELFRIVKAGVKYSAMPSWPADRRDDEMWQLVAFLRALPTMSPKTFRQLAVVAPGQNGTPAAFGPPPLNAAIRCAMKASRR